MFCIHCGTELPDGAKFCFSCGASINGAKTATQFINRVQLKCKSCNGVMDIDENRPILMCPFCGSKEIILEGDKVTIQRIKSKAYRDVEFEKQQTYREVELGKRELELKDSSNKFKRVLISFLIMLVGAVIVYWSLWNVSLGGLLIGIIVIIAGVVSLRHSNGNKDSEDRHSRASRQKTGHATREDVEMAKVQAKEKDDKRTIIFALIMWLICMGILLLMWLVEG